MAIRQGRPVHPVPSVSYSFSTRSFWHSVYFYCRPPRSGDIIPDISQDQYRRPSGDIGRRAPEYRHPRPPKTSRLACIDLSLLVRNKKLSPGRSWIGWSLFDLLPNGTGLSGCSSPLPHLYSMSRRLTLHEADGIISLARLDLIGYSLQSRPQLMLPVRRLVQ